MRVFVLTRAAILRASVIAAIVLISVAVVLFRNDGSISVFGPKDNIPIYSVKTSGMQVAITLDAAWGSDKTQSILDILDKYGIKATFFVTGMWANANEPALRAIAEHGHEVGNHGYTHKDFATLSNEGMIDELKRCTDAIERVTGKRTTIFRAPYGSWNARIVDVVGKEQYDFIQWDVDSLDWKGLTPEQMDARIFSKVQSGSIILFHNDAKYIVEALPLIIEKLQEKGYKPVTVTEIINESLEANQK
jgi:polysaccharide deacetylase family sporulation protein PdaB